MFETSRARQLLQRGQLADAVAAVEGRFRPEDAHLVVSVPDADAVVVLGRAALHTADQQQAELTSAIAQRMLTSGVPGVERHAAWLLALQAHAAGDPAQARRWLATRGEQERLSVFPLVPLDPSEPAARPDRHRQRGHGAGRVGGGSRRAAARDQSRRTLRRGQRRARPRPAHRDAALLARAVGILEAGQRPLALASALEDLAVAETRACRTDQAIAALNRALVIHADCGARWDLARVRRRLRQLGVRRRLAAESRPARGWAAMTDSELAVVRLVADGLTNREVAERRYISPHAVGGHICHAFEKLGITSRVTLTRIASEHPRTAEAHQKIA